jgi:hypothetical protein
MTVQDGPLDHPLAMAHADLVEARTAPSSGRGAVLRAIATLVIAGVAFGFVLPRVVDYRAVAHEVSRLSAPEFTVLALVMTGRWVAMGGVYASVVPGIGLARGMQAYLSCNAVMSMVPGPVDLALRYRFFQGWGRSPAEARTSIVGAGYGTLLTKLMLPIVAMVIALLAGSPFSVGTASACVGALVGVALLGVAVQRLLHRRGGRIAQELIGASELIRDRWPWMVLANASAVALSILLLTPVFSIPGGGERDRFPACDCDRIRARRTGQPCAGLERQHRGGRARADWFVVTHGQ